MDGTAVMAKSRKSKVSPKAQPASESREDLIAIRCRAAYKDWLQRFADSERSTPTNLVDKALAELAKAMKFEEPPKR